VLISVSNDHTAASAERHWNIGKKRIMFRDITGSFEERSYLGNRTGSLQANLPKSARLAWHGGDMAMLLREAWNVEEKTYTADTILGLRLQDVLGSVPRPTILRCGAVHAAFFVHGFLLSGLLDEVRPHFQLFRLDGLGGWHKAVLPATLDAGMVSVSRLDDLEHESDGSLLITA